MRISVSANTLSNNGLLTPVDPPPPLDINDLFELELFRASKTTFFPFNEIEIEWSIKAKDSNTVFGDFAFSLVATDTELENDLDSSGVVKFAPHRNTLLRILGRRRQGGSGGTTLGSTITLSVDDSLCLMREVPAIFLDEQVKGALSNLTSQTAQLRLRNQEVVSTWDMVGAIGYYFPLEIIINNFFNADLDVNIEIAFRVHHNSSESELDVSIGHSSDVNFHGGEDFLSGGSSAIIAATADRLVPLILECELRSQELQLIRSFVAFLKRDLDTHRLLEVRINRQENARLASLAFVLCPLPN